MQMSHRAQGEGARCSIWCAAVPTFLHPCGVPCPIPYRQLLRLWQPQLGRSFGGVGCVATPTVPIVTVLLPMSLVCIPHPVLISPFYAPGPCTPTLLLIGPATGR